MENSFTIRQVTAGDIEQIQNLLEQEAAHNGHDLPQDSPYHPENSAVAIVNASLNNEDLNTGWLAFSGEQAIGIITTPQALAGGVFVSDEYRGQGVGPGLIRERENYFKNELGLSEVERPVRADNKESIKMHIEKLGYTFSKASQELMESTPDIPGNTVLYMTKTL